MTTKITARKPAKPASSKPAAVLSVGRSPATTRAGKTVAVKRAGAEIFTTNFAEAYLAPGISIVERVRVGVPAREVMELSTRMGFAQSRIVEMLDIPSSTLRRKMKNMEVLDKSSSERLIGLERLIGQVEVMMKESGDETRQDFNAASWVAGWLEQPMPALGGRKPGDYLDTNEGQRYISQLLGQMQSGAYA